MDSVESTQMVVMAEAFLTGGSQTPRGYEDSSKESRITVKVLFNFALSIR